MLGFRRRLLRHGGTLPYNFIWEEKQPKSRFPAPAGSNPKGGSLMPLPAWVLLSFVLWVVSEAVAYALILRLLGFAGAILLTILTSLAGLAMLRRLSLAGAWRLRRSLAMKAEQRTSLSRETIIDGALSTIGSILLILPGFVSDFAGLALAAPSIRGWVAARLPIIAGGAAQKPRRGAPDLVDLSPQDWSRRDERGPREPRMIP